MVNGQWSPSHPRRRAQSPVTTWREAGSSGMSDRFQRVLHITSNRAISNKYGSNKQQQPKQPPLFLFLCCLDPVACCLLPVLTVDTRRTVFANPN
jgi:hypothetical protein